MNHTDQTLTSFEHTFIGVYLIVSGILTTFLNLIGLVVYWRFPRLLCTPSAIPEIALLLADLAASGLNPFSGAAALQNRWIWDDHAGCQLYAFFGFVFGDFQVLCIPFLAFDRYIITAENSALRKYRTRKTYSKLLLLLIAYSLFWSVTPLLGWASFAKTAPGIVCTINWMKVDVSFVSYLTAKFIASFMASLVISMIFYRKAIRLVHKNRAREIHWCRKKSIRFVSFGCMFSTYLSFAIYATVCMWAIIAGPQTIPRIFNALPAVWVKLAGIFNPIFFVYYNPRLWACTKKMFGLNYDNEQMHRDKTEERIWMDSPRNTARSIRTSHDPVDTTHVVLHPADNE
uniref:G-protein coupled receptors family 1 profile domain-containing protein n=1 Tax=Plectus sambesii TaxID=2011161 RepID=A0A914WVD8_9BILA